MFVEVVAEATGVDAVVRVGDDDWDVLRLELRVDIVPRVEDSDIVVDQVRPVVEIVVLAEHVYRPEEEQESRRRVLGVRECDLSFILLVEQVLERLGRFDVPAVVDDATVAAKDRYRAVVWVEVVFIADVGGIREYALVSRCEHVAINVLVDSDEVLWPDARYSSASMS